MALPKLNVASYAITLPSGKKTKFRPFTVKERSILLLALQEGDATNIYNAIGDLFLICTNGECIIDKMPIVDSEFLFINIRNKSVGEELDLLHSCECEKENTLKIDLSAVKIVGTPPTKEIDIADGNFLIMNYPTLKDSSILSEDPSEDEIVTVIASCIDSIVTGKSVYKAADSTLDELKDFVNALNQIQITKIEKFFESLPKVVVEGEYTCSCGKHNVVVLEGLQNFFQ